jgi:hypothetical protein
MVIGIFDDYTGAARAVDQLRAAKFSTSDISLIGRDPDELRPVVSELSSHKPDKLMTRLGIAGAIGGLFVGLTTIFLPGIGAFALAGPLVGAISGIAAGSALGVVAGALVHFDVPESEAKVYEAHITEGKVLVAVHTDKPEERIKAEQIFDDSGAVEVDSKAA